MKTVEEWEELYSKLHSEYVEIEDYAHSLEHKIYDLEQIIIELQQKLGV